MQSEFVSIQVGFAQHETHSSIKTIRRLPRGSRREIHGDRPVSTGMIESSPIQRLADTMATGALVDHHVLDPGADSGRDAKHGQRERADDGAVESGHEQSRGLRGDQCLESRTIRRRIGRRQLRDQSREGRHQFVVDPSADVDGCSHGGKSRQPRFYGCPMTRITDHAELSRKARDLGAALEPFVGQVYFSPECHANYVALGFGPSPGEMNGVALPEGIAYFTSRGSLMGRVPGEVVAAAFAVFNPAAVIPAVTAGWNLTDAGTICAARRSGAIAQLERILGAKPGGVAQARAILQRAVGVLRPEGRPLFAGALSQSVPDTDLGAAWHFGDMLREYRGDSHTAAWISAGVDATEIGLLTELYWGLPLKSYSRTRAWSEDDFAAAIDRLESRGLIHDGSFTDAGRDIRERIEQDTDRQMRDCLEVIGDDFERLVAILGPWSEVVRNFKGYPSSGPHELAAAAQGR